MDKKVKIVISSFFVSLSPFLPFIFHLLSSPQKSGANQLVISPTNKCNCPLSPSAPTLLDEQRHNGQLHHSLSSTEKFLSLSPSSHGLDSSVKNISFSSSARTVSPPNSTTSPQTQGIHSPTSSPTIQWSTATLTHTKAMRFSCNSDGLLSFWLHSLGLACQNSHHHPIISSSSSTSVFGAATGASAISSPVISGATAMSPARTPRRPGSSLSAKLHHFGSEKEDKQKERQSAVGMSPLALPSIQKSEKKEREKKEEKIAS